MPDDNAPQTVRPKPSPLNAALAFALTAPLAAVLAGVWLGQSWLAGLLAFAVTTAGVLLAWQWRLRRRLRGLLSDTRHLLEEESTDRLPARPSEQLSALLAMQAPLEQRMKHEQNLLRAEAQRRVHAENQLRETEERYTLAVSGASDGMWEWGLGSASTYFSPRWKSMLGYAEDEIGGRIEEWYDRIHPQDRDRVMTELQAHLEQGSTRFENEHRLRHKDGGWRWVLSRAAAVRHASGRAYRVVGLNLDISARKQAQEVLVELAEGLQGLHGEHAYTALVRKFAGILDMEEAFLCECYDQAATRVRMLAHWRGGESAPCVEYDLAGTPCRQVIVTGATVFTPSGAGARWACAQRDGIDSYLGLPCFDTRGQVIGHLACLDRKPMQGELPHDAVLRLFAVRASVEMERRLLERMRDAHPSAQVPATDQRDMHG
jgi:PAS domain S-box-containing protein